MPSPQDSPQCWGSSYLDSFLYLRTLFRDWTQYWRLQYMFAWILWTLLSSLLALFVKLPQAWEWRWGSVWPEPDFQRFAWLDTGTQRFAWLGCCPRVLRVKVSLGC